MADANEAVVTGGGAGGPGEPRGRICFVCPMCVLDPTSGAAISVRNFLRCLAEAGYRVTSYTSSVMDPNGEVPFAPILGPAAADEKNRGMLLRREEDGVEHFVFLTASSRGANMTADEQTRMVRLFKQWLGNHPQDIILTFGKSNLQRLMIDLAVAEGAAVVHYLANAETRTAEHMLPGERIITPSEFLQSHYRETLGVEADVLRTIMPDDRVVGPDEPSIANAPALRQLGFVTFVNPIPHKGLTLVARLMQRALRERPEMRFLVVEGRMPRGRLQELKVDIGALRNCWFIPSQLDVKGIWRRTAILLMPSFWREGFPRSVQEGQLSGLPILASPRGGVPEALNGGGRIIEVGDAVVERHLNFPPDGIVDLWWQALVELWDDEDAYRAAVARAREAGARWHPDNARPKVVAYFDAVMAAKR